MRKLIGLFLCLTISFMMISGVEAKTVNHFQGKFDNYVTSEDEVNGSVALAGSNAEMKGKADGASFMAGNKVVFSGESEYGAFVGNSIEIDGIITKDAFIAGNVIDISKDANLQRDVMIAGSDIEIRGTIGRDMNIYGSTVNLSGAKIEGNVSIYATNIKINDNTVINGNLSYPEDASVSIEKGSIKGKTTKTEAMAGESESFASILMGQFWSFMSLLLVFAVLSLAAPKLFTKIQDKYDKFDFNKGLETFTKGLVFLILVPIIIFILLLMSIGIPLALILLALYFIIMYLSMIFTGYLVGFKIWQKFFNKDINLLVVGLLGLAILFILNLIPGVSFIVSMLSMFIGIGIIYDVFLKKLGSRD